MILFPSINNTPPMKLTTMAAAVVPKSAPIFIGFFSVGVSSDILDMILSNS